MPNETIAEVMGGREPRLIMDIHSISDVNSMDISEIPGPVTSENFLPARDELVEAVTGNKEDQEKI